MKGVHLLRGKAEASRRRRIKSFNNIQFQLIWELIQARPMAMAVAIFVSRRLSWPMMRSVRSICGYPKQRLTDEPASERASTRSKYVLIPNFFLGDLVVSCKDDRMKTSTTLLKLLLSAKYASS